MTENLKIRALRKINDLTLKEMANKSNLSTSKINRIEQSDKPPKPEDIKKIITGLNMTQEEFEAFNPTQAFHNHQEASDFFLNTGTVQQPPEENTVLHDTIRMLNDRLVNQEALNREMAGALRVAQETINELLRSSSTARV
jgi:transcriptional regulator with XRE-family HTH domain